MGILNVLLFGPTRKSKKHAIKRSTDVTAETYEVQEAA